MPRSTALALVLVGILLFIPVLIFAVQAVALDHTTLHFPGSEGASLHASYYPGSLPAGVILLEGFGSDQVTLQALLHAYLDAGFHAFTFDFSGHGRSGGTLGFDNAQTDRQAQELLAAVEAFKAQSGLEEGQMVLSGHSLGARVALQTAPLMTEAPAGLVLLGTQVNLGSNVQSEFFTGTSDSDLVWVQALGPETPGTHIALLSGSLDDILTPASAQQLAEKLNGEALEEGEMAGSASENALRIYHIYPGVLHNYEVFSPRMIADSVAWSLEMAGLDVPLPPNLLTRAWLRIAAWIAGIIGLFLLLAGAPHLLERPAANALQIHIQHIRRFLWGKLLLWLPALVAGALLAALFFLVPAGFPAFNMIYVAFIGGYGLIMLLLYWRGWTPGVRGRLPFRQEQTKTGLRGTLLALLAGGVLLALTALVARSGWFFTYPLNDRLIWLLLFTPVTAIGFGIGGYEGQMLREARARRLQRLGHTLIGLFPFFLWAIVLAAIGSLSGLVGSLQGLVILGLVLLSGNLFQRLGRRTWLAALLQALLLYWLILPQGVLFGF